MSKATTAHKLSKLQRAFATLWRQIEPPTGVVFAASPFYEYRFAAVHVGLGNGVREKLKRAGLKDWRFDVAFPDLKTAVALEGGTFVKGRHVRGRGYSGDCAKYNAAQELGWVILRFTTDMLDERGAQCIEQVQRVLVAREQRAEVIAELKATLSVLGVRVGHRADCNVLCDAHDLPCNCGHGEIASNTAKLLKQL